MKIKKKHSTSKNDLLSIGQKFFYLGLVLLPTIQPISFTSFFIALIISLKINKQNFLHDKWNLFLLLSSGFIIFNSLNVLLVNPIINNSDNFLLVIFNALKWIILFISFTSFQCYLKTNLQRINFAKFFIIGSIPIFISCFLQYWFEIYGPFKFLNGFIVWYNLPMDYYGDADGVSGLFTNQNYTGFWLSIIWPFSIYFLRKHKYIDLKKILLIFLSGFTFYLIFMTTSRSAILGLIISLPLILSIKLLIKVIIILFFFYLLIINIPEVIFIQNDIYIPKTIKILIEKITNYNLFASNSRIEIWRNTLRLISAKPFLGYGAGLFPIVYLTLSDYSAQHAHNIILQIAFDYGLFLSIGLSVFVLILLFKTWQKISTYSNNLNFNDKPIEIYWFASALVAIVSQLYDVTYFDGRLSLLIWLLLTGLKTIIDEDLNTLKKLNN